MTTNFNVDGVDLDSVFAPYTSGVKKATTGFTVGGVDVSDLYAPIESGTAAAVTGYLISGSDLNTFFAAIGSTGGGGSLGISGLDGKTVSSNDPGTDLSGQVYADTVVIFEADGTWRVEGNNQSGATAQPSPTNGIWLTSGVAGDYEIQFTITSSGHIDYMVGSSSDAPAWTPITSQMSVFLAMQGADINFVTPRSATATVNIQIRNSTTMSVVSDSTVTMNVSTAGNL